MFSILLDGSCDASKIRRTKLLCPGRLWQGPDLSIEKLLQNNYEIKQHPPIFRY